MNIKTYLIVISLLAGLGGCKPAPSASETTAPPVVTSPVASDVPAVPVPTPPPIASEPVASPVAPPITPPVESPVSPPVASEPIASPVIPEPVASEPVASPLPPVTIPVIPPEPPSEPAGPVFPPAPVASEPVAGEPPATPVEPPVAPIVTEPPVTPPVEPPPVTPEPPPEPVVPPPPPPEPVLPTITPIYTAQAGATLYSAIMTSALLQVNHPAPFTWVAPDSIQVNTAANTYFTMPMDISVAAGKQVAFECDLKAMGVTTPAQSWQGIVCEIVYDTPDHVAHYSGFSNAFGTFDWKTFSATLDIPDNASNGRVIIGMQGSTGIAQIKNWRLTLLRDKVTWPAIDPLWQPTRDNSYRGVHTGRYVNTMMADLANWKVNVVRYELNTDQATASSAESYATWFDAKLVELDNVIADAALRHIKVSIDLHMTPGGRLADGSNAMFYDAALQDQFIHVWQVIAARYKNNPAVFAYELVNEPVQVLPVPNGLFDWRNLQLKAAVAIRAIDWNTPISISVDNYDGAGNFKWLQPLTEVPGVIYSVHMYEPMGYTHQGVYAQYPAAGTVTYPGTLNGKALNKQSLRTYLQPVRDFQMANHVPIWVSEFSAVRWAPGAAQYLTDASTIFEEYQWNWAYMAYNEWPGWDLQRANMPVVGSPIVSSTDRMLAIRYWFDLNSTP